MGAEAECRETGSIMRSPGEVSWPMNALFNGAHRTLLRRRHVAYWTLVQVAGLFFVQAPSHQNRRIAAARASERQQFVFHASQHVSVKGKGARPNKPNPLIYLVEPIGIEPTTS